MTCTTARPLVGDKPVTVITFTPDAGDPGAVATTVSTTLRDPAGNVTHPEATEISPNAWRVVWPVLDQDGLWTLYVAATAGLNAAQEQQVNVRTSRALGAP